ncbi:protein OBERON 2-like [Phalaenopsis equestris]|uniref:protein OBERON 2-like n=1 Tax=Phalaenopsis equestris TaxID=78828 RepID=UPI0009E2C4FB|nr:protein OBERON 2-like [Phalaenopsis equestris]
MCASVKKIGFQPKIKACDICCSESGFCRDCCCILCCGCVDSARGGFSFIRCQAILEKDLTCGHVAHIDCALRAYMAGTVGGSIGLDAEYYCRRCDNKTDLIQHVIKMMEICKSFDSPDDIEKVLNLGSCILFGSEKVRAKKLRYSIGTIVSKLNLGISLTDIWKAENDFLTVSAAPSGKEVVLLDSSENSRADTPIESICDAGNSFHNVPNEREREGPLYITSDHKIVSAKLEDEIDRALHNLKKSQESEYKIAEEKLYAQKDFLLSLYQQLEAERGDLGRQAPLSNGRDSDALLTIVLTRVDQIKNEEMKLKQMMRIADGFGRTPGTILRECFDILVDD